MNDRRIDLIHGQGWARYASSIAGHALYFGAIGPAIGAVASPGVIIYPVAFVAAYIVSFFSAVLAGTAVGAVAPFIRGRWLYLAGAGIGAACGGLIPFAFQPGAHVYAAVMVMYAISGAVAALACTRLTRFIRRAFEQ